MKGPSLIQQICSATDLPSDVLETEVSQLLSKHNLSAQEVTLDQFREVVAEYLQDILVDLKKELDSF